MIGAIVAVLFGLKLGVPNCSEKRRLHHPRRADRLERQHGHAGHGGALAAEPRDARRDDHDGNCRLPSVLSAGCAAGPRQMRCSRACRGAWPCRRARRCGESRHAAGDHRSEHQAVLPGGGIAPSDQQPVVATDARWRCCANPVWWEIALVVAASAAVALCCERLRVPAGLFVGSILTSAVFYVGGIAHGALPAADPHPGKCDPGHFARQPLPGFHDGRTAAYAERWHRRLRHRAGDLRPGRSR